MCRSRLLNSRRHILKSMQKWAIMIVALHTFSVMAAASDRKLDAPGPLNREWIAFGELRGYLEPCGCDPSTDLGGLRRISAAVSRERALRPELLVFDLGNNLAVPAVEPTERVTLKLPFMIEGIGRLAPSSSLLNVNEIAQLSALTAAIRERQLAKPMSDGTSIADTTVPNYVISNARPGKIPVEVARDAVMGERFTVVGYVWRDELSQTLDPVTKPAVLAHLRRLLLAQANAFRVVLFSGPDAHLEIIRRAGISDLIISASTSDLTVQPGTAERSLPGRLIRLSDRLGTVRMVPLGGQGFIRGGRAAAGEARPLSEIMSGPSVVRTTPAMSAQTPAISMAGVTETWLDRSHGGDTELEGLFNRYKSAATDQFAASVRLRTMQLEETKFAGSAACAACHADAHKKWQSSAHAVAYDILITKGRHTDPECVSCHVLGSKDPGGFVSKDVSPQFAHVQCENCHGPRLDHTRNPTIKSTVNAREVCKSCHYDPHSPKFDYATYWKQIEHK